MLQFPQRVSKPRAIGITSIHDVSLTVGELKNILNDHACFVDFAKFGVGSAYVTPRLDEKIEIYKKYGVEPYFGGTLFEKFYAHNKLDAYLRYLHEYGISIIEISTGIVDIEFERRVAMIREISSDFTVFSEVGSKDQDRIMAPSVWINEIHELMNAGASYIVTEGRDSGTAGIFRSSGEIRTGLVDDIIHQCDVDKLIFEAPTPTSQMFFINLVGANVNLGNVKPTDLLLLETERIGLRAETFGNFE